MESRLTTHEMPLVCSVSDEVTVGVGRNTQASLSMVGQSDLDEERELCLGKMLPSSLTWLPLASVQEVNYYPIEQRDRTPLAKKKYCKITVLSTSTMFRQQHRRTPWSLGQVCGPVGK